MELTQYPQTTNSLHTGHFTKQDLFSEAMLCRMGYNAFDYALPQPWLNAFQEYCKEHCMGVTYDLVRSTCVWAYGQDKQGPVTACYEVMMAYGMWQCHVNGGEMPKAAAEAKRELTRIEVVKQIKELERKLAQLTRTDWRTVEV